MYACPIGGTFFDELCLLMIGFDRGQRVGQGTGKKEKGKRRGAACFSFGRWAKARPTLLNYCGALGRRPRIFVRDSQRFLLIVPSY